jgi:hypothetical protein
MGSLLFLVSLHRVVHRHYAAYIEGNHGGVGNSSIVMPSAPNIRVEQRTPEGVPRTIKWLAPGACACRARAPVAATECACQAIGNVICYPPSKWFKRLNC